MAVKDEYWYQNVLLPLFVKPLFKFFTKLPSDIQELDLKDQAGIKGYLKILKKDKNELITRSIPLESVASGAFQEISDLLDEVDDLLTIHTSNLILTLDGTSLKNIKSPDEVVKETFIILDKIIAALINNHFKV